MTRLSEEDEEVLLYTSLVLLCIGLVGLVALQVAQVLEKRRSRKRRISLLPTTTMEPHVMTHENPIAKEAVIARPRLRTGPRPTRVTLQTTK